MNSEPKADIVNVVVGAALLIGSAVLIAINGVVVTTLLFFLGGVYLVSREVRKALKRQ